MAKQKIFHSAFSFPIDEIIKEKAMYILQKEHGKTITYFLRESLFALVASYEKENGILDPQEFLKKSK